MSTTTTSMPLVVQEEPLESVHAEVLALFSQTRKSNSDTARFDWLYKQNPDGKAVIWTVREEGFAELAGFTVALPRRVWVDGVERRSWNCADFSINVRYRTLGPALKLRRAARIGVDSGRADFLYAHPNDRMAAIHEQVGHNRLGQMIRVARPLRSSTYLQERIGNRALSTITGSLIVDPVLRLAGRETWHRPTTSVKLLDACHFDERFDHMFDELAPRTGVIGVRDAQYLNWRYFRNPLYKTQALVAEDSGRVRGYLLFTIRDQGCEIKDVFPPDDENVTRDLLAAAIGAARQRRAVSVSFTALETHPALLIFTEFGFRRRAEHSWVYTYAPEDYVSRTAVYRADRWFMTVGDRDV